MIPSLRVVEDIPDCGVLVELVGGEHTGANILLVPADRVLPGVATRRRPEVRRWGPPIFPEHRFADSEPFAKSDAASRAEVLLESLLDCDQRADWQRGRTFWVRTPYGVVELGHLSRLRFHGPNGRRFVLCVVPRGHADLPSADIWTNLLLVLRAEPERFFAVANYCGSSGTWRSGPVPLPTLLRPRDTTQVSHQGDSRALAR